MVATREPSAFKAKEIDSGEALFELARIFLGKIHPLLDTRSLFVSTCIDGTTRTNGDFLYYMSKEVRPRPRKFAKYPNFWE
jgi:hypothetical protein